MEVAALVLANFGGFLKAGAPPATQLLPNCTEQSISSEKDKILLSGVVIIGTIPESVVFQKMNVTDGHHDRIHDFSGDCDQYCWHRS